MSETDKPIVSPPPPPGAKPKRFPVGFVQMVECCLLTWILLAILIFVVPRFRDSLAGLSSDLPALTVVVMSASDVVKNHWHVFVPLAGAVMAGLLVLPFVWPGRLTVVIGTVLLITLVAAAAAVLLGIYLPLIGLYGAGPK
ncbi:MAG: hypothetical protein SVV80_01115 [Planctomycetota bacterium]|nr:hypothetical protein [Planctomycetota bacterium]